ncbi:MAG: hypothetical protein J6P84_01455 [Alphaproteobacteria bacterium]|nr:hypothetical protein [Alphaproteobacteria bacterium]MBO7641550.1 hypothetical protein [Alphaproteobacteria bacterium]
MIPWDFGLIQALREKIGWEIFPSDPPETIDYPYLILEIGEMKYRSDQTILVEMNLRLIDSNKPSCKIYEFCKTLQKIIMEDLSLCNGEQDIGKAALKIDRIVTAKTGQVIKLIAIIKLKNIEGE